MMKQVAWAWMLISVAYIGLGAERSQANEGWNCILLPGKYRLSLSILGEKLVNNAAGTPASLVVENTEERVVAFRQSWINHLPISTVYIINKASGEILEISNAAAASGGEILSLPGPTLNKGVCSKE